MAFFALGELTRSLFFKERQLPLTPQYNREQRRLSRTNAYTEEAHAKMKLIKMMSYGHRKVEVYIKKVLLAFLPATIITLVIYHNFYGRAGPV